MRIAVQAVPIEPIYYPDTDGKPMAESDSQRKPLTYLVEALDLHFQGRPEVYVSGNLLIYYEEGNPRKSVAPDVFVVLGVPKYDRDIYRTWVEGKGPDLVIEITSPSTRHIDDKDKPRLYRQLGVQEYFQYDPNGKYLKPALRGRRLNPQGQYEYMSAVQGFDGSVILTSTLLGLQLRLEAGKLRVFDPHTAEYLDTYSEAVIGRRQAESQARVEQQRAELARQHTELALQHAESERQRAELERQRAELAQQRAELAQQRADKLAAQLRARGFDPDQLL